jgi:hypothetical protein
VTAYSENATKDYVGRLAALKFEGVEIEVTAAFVKLQAIVLFVCSEAENREATKPGICLECTARDSKALKDSVKDIRSGHNDCALSDDKPRHLLQLIRNAFAHEFAARVSPQSDNGKLSGFELKLSNRSSRYGTLKLNKKKSTRFQMNCLYQQSASWE